MDKTRKVVNPIDVIKKIVEDKKVIEGYIASGGKDQKIKDEIKKRGIKFVNPL